MQILKIKLTDEEQSIIVAELIKRFHTEDSKQCIEGQFNDLTWDAELTLYTELEETPAYDHYSYSDDYRVAKILYRSVSNFRLTFYHEGDEVEYTNADSIYETILKYYEI